MNITISDLDFETRRIALSGPLSQSRIESVARKLVPAATAARRNVVLDMAAVSHIASKAIQVLIDVARRLARRGHSLTLVRCQPDVADLISILGLSSVLSITDDAEKNIAVSEFEHVRSAYL